MTEKERLVNLLKSPHKAEQLRKMGVSIGNYEDDCIEVMVADYLLANGVIVPPCKVGDTVFMPWEWKGQKGVACLKVTAMRNILGFGWGLGTDFDTDDEGYADKYNCGNFKFDDVGKTVFITREEAEKALKERSNNG